MKKNIIALVSTLLLAACGSNASNSGNLESAQSRPVKTSVETIVTGVKFKGTNGGINPDFFATIITGSVMLGTNSCFGGGKDAKFEATQVGKEIHVRALLTSSLSNIARICPMHYAPVFKTISITVRGDVNEIEHIVVENVEAMGKQVIH